MIGGQQGNSLLELIKQGKLHKKAPPAKKDDKAATSSRPVSAGPTTEVCCIHLNAAILCMLLLLLLRHIVPFTFFNHRGVLHSTDCSYSMYVPVIVPKYIAVHVCQKSVKSSHLASRSHTVTQSQMAVP